MNLLYCLNGQVIATHDDSQNIPALTYGAGTVVIPWSRPRSALARVGPAPAAGQVGDTRPYAQPALSSQGELLAYANYKQWELATAGYAFRNAGGTSYTFPTDATSQNLICAKYIRLQAANPPTSINWQFGPLEWATVAAADLSAAAILIADFVQATFNTLQMLEAGIESGAVTTQAQIDAASWPANHN